MLIYIRDNNNLGFKYYAKIEDSLLSNLSRQSIIKTDNQLMVFYDSSCKDCTDNGRSTGAYIVFYQYGKIDNFTQVPGTVSQSSAESEQNAKCTAVMCLEHFRILNNEMLNKDSDMVSEQASLIILCSKSAI